ncbi:FRG domain-containing protein [Capnocytophaga gingivalis]|uniref:FRG domain-containing protein n=1 Tax=Capnocytophaga gingivalis TaxID=1017 RepID=A0ABU5Y7Y1_9FLAO|nr:FRG domain-containing protein [Capnocytophaga gingivalis]MEB3040040.1 FRG domain-containing protein [Capnocytophaga gingivalis]
MDTQNIKNKENITYIESVSDFLNDIKGIRNKSGYTLFYRGHSDKNYELKPSIYRNENFIKNEDKIYRETIAKVPYDFNGKSSIESLALMQHYGVPTRILDLTTNALVALYFACEESKKIKEITKVKGGSFLKKVNIDGEVIIFNIPNESVCYSDSDKVTILANLSKYENNLHYEKNTSYKQDISDVEIKIKEILKKTLKVINIDAVLEKAESLRYYSLNKKEELKKYYEDYRLKNIDKKIEDIIIENYKGKEKIKDDIKSFFTILLLTILKTIIDEAEQSYINSLNEKDPYLKKLLHYIREDKSYFKPIINPNDIGKILAVKPKLDNPRIVRQQGAFLIFGAESSFVYNSTKPMPEIKKDWIIKGNNNNKIIIKSSKKESILKELDKLGINKSTLFPEIDKVADYIKEKYTQKENNN